MRALVVLLPLLLCAVVGVSQVRAEVKAVKLCGREFLRAVVYTCGGSRWRRLLSEPDMDGESTPFFLRTKGEWPVMKSTVYSFALFFVEETQTKRSFSLWDSYDLITAV